MNFRKKLKILILILMSSSFLLNTNISATEIKKDDNNIKKQDIKNEKLLNKKRNKPKSSNENEDSFKKPLPTNNKNKAKNNINNSQPSNKNKKEKNNSADDDFVYDDNKHFEGVLNHYDKCDDSDMIDYDNKFEDLSVDDSITKYGAINNEFNDIDAINNTKIKDNNIKNDEIKNKNNSNLFDILNCNDVYVNLQKDANYLNQLSIPLPEYFYYINFCHSANDILKLEPLPTISKNTEYTMHIRHIVAHINEYIQHLEKIYCQYLKEQDILTKYLHDLEEYNIQNISYILSNVSSINDILSNIYFIKYIESILENNELISTIPPNVLNDKIKSKINTLKKLINSSFSAVENYLTTLKKYFKKIYDNGLDSIYIADPLLRTINQFLSLITVVSSDKKLANDIKIFSSIRDTIFYSEEEKASGNIQNKKIDILQRGFQLHNSFCLKLGKFMSFLNNEISKKNINLPNTQLKKLCLIINNFKKIIDFEKNILNNCENYINAYKQNINDNYKNINTENLNHIKHATVYNDFIKQISKMFESLITKINEKLEKNTSISNPKLNLNNTLYKQKNDGLDLSDDLNDNTEENKYDNFNLLLKFLDNAQKDDEVNENNLYNPLKYPKYDLQCLNLQDLNKETDLQLSAKNYVVKKTEISNQPNNDFSPQALSNLVNKSNKNNIGIITNNIDNFVDFLNEHYGDIKNFKKYAFFNITFNKDDFKNIIDEKYIKSKNFNLFNEKYNLLNAYLTYLPILISLTNNFYDFYSLLKDAVKNELDDAQIIYKEQFTAKDKDFLKNDPNEEPLKILNDKKNDPNKELLNILDDKYKYLSSSLSGIKKGIQKLISLLDDIHTKTENNHSFKEFYSNETFKKTILYDNEKILNEILDGKITQKIKKYIEQISKLTITEKSNEEKKKKEEEKKEKEKKEKEKKEKEKKEKEKKEEEKKEEEEKVNANKRLNILNVINDINKELEFYLENRLEFIKLTKSLAFQDNLEKILPKGVDKEKLISSVKELNNSITKLLKTEILKFSQTSVEFGMKPDYKKDFVDISEKNVIEKLSKKFISGMLKRFVKSNNNKFDPYFNKFYVDYLKKHQSLSQQVQNKNMQK